MSVLVHTVRFRLTLWYAASVSLVLAVFGALLYGLVHYQLSRHHDGGLQAAAAQVSQVLSEHEDCERLTDEQHGRLDQIGHTILFHEVEGERRVFYRSPTRPAGQGGSTSVARRLPRTTGGLRRFPGTTGRCACTRSPTARARGAGGSSTSCTGSAT